MPKICIYYEHSTAVTKNVAITRLLNDSKVGLLLQLIMCASRLHLDLRLQTSNVYIM
jgi:hypothetical protein